MRRSVGPHTCGPTGRWSCRCLPPPLHGTRKSKPPTAGVAGSRATNRFGRYVGQGWTGQAIAQQLRMGKTTVFRYLRSPTFAERTYKRRGHSILNPYKDLLLQHWNQGCQDARQVFQRPPTAGLPGQLCHRGALCPAVTAGAGAGTPPTAPGDAPAARRRGTPARPPHPAGDRLARAPAAGDPDS